MQNNFKLKIAVLSEYSSFNNNIYSIFSMLPVNGVLAINIDSIFDIGNIVAEKKTDLIILNKASYTNEEIIYLLNLDFKHISCVVLIDSYFRYDTLFNNFNKGFITIRRPISINKFLEVLKIVLFGNLKKQKSIGDIKNIRTLEMAKQFLVIYENMYEDDAHKYIERLAMNNRLTLYDEALNIVVNYLLEKENINYEYKN